MGLKPLDTHLGQAIIIDRTAHRLRPIGLRIAFDGTYKFKQRHRSNVAMDDAAPLIPVSKPYLAPR